MVWYNKWIWFGLSLVPAVVMTMVYLSFGAVRPPVAFQAAQATESFWNPATWGAIESQLGARDAATESYFQATAYSFGLSKTTLGWATVGLALTGLMAAGTILASAKSYAPAAEATAAAAAATAAASLRNQLQQLAYATALKTAAATAMAEAETPADGISFTPDKAAPAAEPVVVAPAATKVIVRPKKATNKKAAPASAWTATPPKQRSPSWAPKQKPPLVVEV